MPRASSALRLLLARCRPLVHRGLQLSEVNLTRFSKRADAKF